MKQFFKFMFASMLGTILSGVVLFFLIGITIAGMVSMSASTFSNKIEHVSVASNSVLKISLNNEIRERANNKDIQFDFTSFQNNSAIGLDDIVATIKKAKTDDRISGIYLDLMFIPAGRASVEEIRNALLDFKTSGKWIYAYSEIMTQGAYYLASVSDKVFLYPTGIMDWRGLSAQTFFLKDMMEKVGVEMQIIRGSNNKFKSAVEPFMLDHMSEANKEQTMTYVGGFWNHMVDGVASQRNLTQETLNNLADSLKINSAEDAVENGLVDGVKYKDEMTAFLKSELSLEEDDKIKFISLRKYIKAKPQKKGKADSEKTEFTFNKDKVAVIYAVGSIESGEGSDQVIGSERISKAIRKARLDSSVKAIVLRINSPGGSALASDVMWRETVLAKEAKPFIVSMGDVAASGGYYIACMADRIFAHKNTLTGSIGVFGMLPNAQKLLNDKLGVNFDGVKTNAHADMGDISRPLSDFEYRVIQKGVDDIYDDFIAKVAEGRNMSKEEVDAIGQGRVWCGVDAKRIGLVDEFGSLQDAIDYAAEQADVEDYRTIKLPKQKDPVEELLQEFAEMSVGSIASIFAKESKIPFVEEVEYLQSVKEQDRIQARLPFLYEVK